MNFSAWETAYPEAAKALINVLYAQQPAPTTGGPTEAANQQRVRFNAAQVGWAAWRNNVGATPSKCPDCGAPQRPIRYGLANDSKKLNRHIKSSDLILAIPRVITPEMVGTIIAQFGSIETKKTGWRYTGKDQEPGQAAWLALINKLGGYAKFSTGDL